MQLERDKAEIQNDLDLQKKTSDENSRERNILEQMKKENDDLKQEVPLKNAKIKELEFRIRSEEVKTKDEIITKDDNLREKDKEIKRLRVEKSEFEELMNTYVKQEKAQTDRLVNKERQLAIRCGGLEAEVADLHMAYEEASQRATESENALNELRIQVRTLSLM